MKSRTIVILSLFIVFFLVSSSLLCQIDYNAPENILSFAEYLYQNGDYLRAAGEFQRYFFTVKTTEQGDTILFKIGQCYQLGNQPETAVRHYQTLLNNYPQSLILNQTHFQIANLYNQKGEYDKSVDYIENNFPMLTSKSASVKMKQLLGMNYLYQRHWKTARLHFSSLLKDDPTSADSVTIQLGRLANESAKLRYKNGALAGLMSAIIPGTGKIYSGRLTDGLFSLFVIGLYCWQAIDGFNRDGSHSAKGWIYGSVGTIFYLGNIYGSFVAAKIHNERVEENFLSQIQIQLHW